MAKHKRFPGLDCAAPADEMVRLVLRTQLRAMCKLQPKALNWDDPEGVHDMRVLSRRLRSALTDFKPYMRGSSLPNLQLKTIADALGDVRDEDVALAALTRLMTKAKGGAARGIELIADEHRKNQKRARAELKLAIKSSIIEEFEQEFSAKLKAFRIVATKNSDTRRNNGVTAFRDVGREIILARIEELNDTSPHLYSPFQIKELHELRILAKRLRYAIELFADCWPGSVEIAKEVALLQTSLGELHDCDVWLDNLGTRLRQMARRGQRDEPTRQIKAGAVALIREFAHVRTERYREALTRWQHWETDGLLEQFQEALEGSSAPPETSP
jgi:CHAD domain-containing protein